ncbi:hypothetical protein GCM10008019_25360 [Deinococcus soli (ex Cha et al. 2016)]|nr:hypothetical protein GCM10008019_25360 [Deinococcus soli (ex Cha et al. 2016)]
MANMTHTANISVKPRVAAVTTRRASAVRGAVLGVAGTVMRGLLRAMGGGTGAGAQVWTGAAEWDQTQAEFRGGGAAWWAPSGGVGIRTPG